MKYLETAFCFLVADTTPHHAAASKTVLFSLSYYTAAACKSDPHDLSHAGHVAVQVYETILGIAFNLFLNQIIQKIQYVEKLGKVKGKERRGKCLRQLICIFEPFCILIKFSFSWKPKGCVPCFDVNQSIFCTIKKVELGY